jgi:hypothetical protein
MVDIPVTLIKIVSGGQTGVDRGALDAAPVAGFACGGWCPKDRNAEDGPIPARYPMTLLAGGGYRQRTVKNMLDSDGTAILFNQSLSGGTLYTHDVCRRERPPRRSSDADFAGLGARGDYKDTNLKVNEFIFRRADIDDVVSAHLLAMEKAAAIGFGRYIISASTPFVPDDVGELRKGAAAEVRRYLPSYELEYQRRGWSLMPSIDRVYVNERARTQLGWQPKYDFRHIIEWLRASEDASLGCGPRCIYGQGP